MLFYPPADVDVSVHSSFDSPILSKILFNADFVCVFGGGTTALSVVWDKKTTPDLMFLSSKQTDS